MRRRPEPVLLFVFALIGLVLCGAAIAATLSGDHTDSVAVDATLGPLIGLSFLAVGLYAWRRRPEQSIGLLMVAVAYFWFLSALTASNDSVLATAGMYFAPVYILLIIQLLAEFPDRTLEPTIRRLLILGYVTVFVLRLPIFLFQTDMFEGTCSRNCPDNALLIGDHPGIAGTFNVISLAAGVIAIGGVGLLLARRRRAAPAPVRRAQGPVLVTGWALISLLVLTFLLEIAELDTAGELVGLFGLLAFAALPWAFLVGLARSYTSSAAAVERLVRDLGAGSEPDGVRCAIAEALGDPDVELAYWRPSARGFVTRDGVAVDLEACDPGRRVALVERDGRRIGAIVHDAALTDKPELVRAVAAAAALAMANEALEAELRARVDELEVSRARLLEVSLFERRRIERNLHDGAQQRFVALSVQLSLARAKLADDPDCAAELLDGARDELARGLEELRELARGIHPAILSERGLEPALRALADRAPGTVDVERGPGRAPADAGRGRRLLRRRRGADERREVRRGRHDAGRRAPRERSRARRGPRRRRRRCRHGRRHRPPGPRRPARRARRAPGDRLPARARHDRHREDSVRAVVADDSVLLREGIARLLEEAGIEVAGQAGDADDLLRKVGAHRPEVAIVDVRMPPTFSDEGLRAAAVIREEHAQTRVLVLSQDVDEAYALELLADHADGIGYLLKDRISDLDGFVDAVRRVGEGGSALDPEVVARLLGRSRREDPLGALSPREREVLGLMAEGRSNRGIAECMVITERAVEKHVTSMFSKLDLPPTPDDHRRVLAVLRYLQA